MGPTVRTQSSKWSGWLLARVRVRACVHYSTEQQVPKYLEAQVASSVFSIL